MKKVYIIAAVLAVLAGALLLLYLGNLEAPNGTLVETEAVVTAVRDIPAYTTIDATMLTVTNYPKGSAHPKAARNLTDVVGKTTEGLILTGEQVITEKLKAEGSGMSYILPDGMRAITIAVDEVSGIAGFIQIGDYVDVFCNTNTEYSLTYNTTFVVAQNIKIAALDKQLVTTATEGGSTVAISYTYLTLFVTPQQALDIVHSYRAGVLSVALRRFSDHVAADMKPVDNNDLLR